MESGNTVKTPGQFEAEAIAVSHRLKFAVFFAKGIKNNKSFYRIYRRTPKGSVSMIKATASARALASFLKKQEQSKPKASTRSTFKARRNPARRDFRDEHGATRLSTKFVGRAPLDHEFAILDIPKMPDSMAAIGKVSAIEYVAERDGKAFTFRHDFRVRSRPHLAVSPDGNLATMLGGAWLFTEDGFEDQE